MDDDALKIVLFSGVLAGVYLLARFARRISDQANPVRRLEFPELQAPGPEPLRRSPTLVGKEIPFPLDVRELEARHGPGFWRPNLLNYFFHETDLVTGSPDPDAFHDELFVELENPENGYRWTDSFDVVTPMGLTRVMREERSDFVYGTGTIIVRRYDLKTILRAVLEHYAGAEALRRQQETSEAHPQKDEGN